MANAIKRIQWSRDKETQDRVTFYMFQKAKAVLTAGTAGTKQLELSERVYNGTFNKFAACMICASNATIGTAIDAADTVADSDIEYVVGTDQWANMADAEV